MDETAIAQVVPTIEPISTVDWRRLAISSTLIAPLK